MKRFPGKLPTPQMIEEMRPYGTPEEFLRSGGFSIEALDRAAFGFCDTDIKRKRAKEIKIRWKDDRENALYQMQRSGKGPKGWARSVDLTTPVEVSYKSLDGKEPQFYIEDGHHRHLAATILDTELNVELSIEISPGHVLYPDMSYDDFHRDMFRRMENMNESVLGVSGGKLLYHASDQLFKSFDMDKVSGIRGSLYGPGLYFSDNRKYVSMFGKYVYECEVLMRQPFDLTSKNVRGELLKLVSSYEFPSEVQTYVEDTMKSMSYTTLFKELLYIVGVENLKSMGYDGVIGYCEFGGKEYVIWDDKNVSIERVFDKKVGEEVIESGNYLKTRFSEYIRENIENKGKVIYHFTESLDSLLSILQSDSLVAGSSHNMYGLGYDNISFTWNPELWDIEYLGDVKDRYTAKISFDYDRISKKWNFVPFDYGIEEEQEEIVETDIMEGIIPFIIGIEIRGKYPKSDIDYVKRKFPELKIKKVKK